MATNNTPPEILAARLELIEVEKELARLKAEYFAALPLRDNETMDRVAGQIRVCNRIADNLRRRLTLPKGKK